MKNIIVITRASSGFGALAARALAIRWEEVFRARQMPVVEGDGRGELNIRSDLHSIESDRALLKPSNLLTKKVCL